MKDDGTSCPKWQLLFCGFMRRPPSESNKTKISIAIDDDSAPGDNVLEKNEETLNGRGVQPSAHHHEHTEPSPIHPQGDKTESLRNDPLMVLSSDQKISADAATQEASATTIADDNRNQEESSYGGNHLEANIENPVDAANTTTSDDPSTAVDPSTGKKRRRRKKKPVDKAVSNDPFEKLDWINDGRAEQSNWPKRDMMIVKHLAQLNRDPEKQKAARESWENSLGGKILEPALQSGAIALIDARWLVNFVRDNPKAVLPTRQELQKLAPEAFLSCDDVIHSSESSTQGLHIILLSYMWLHPHHPDPKGSTLKLVAHKCQKLLETYREEFVAFTSHDKFFSKELDSDKPCWGLFWDFASLHQKPRTQDEDVKFHQGLSNLARFYSHPFTTVWRVTDPPQGYPEGYDLPSNANTADYYDRGWPFFESCLSSFAQLEQEERSVNLNINDSSDGKKSFSIPLGPEQMREHLEGKTFTNGEEDQEMVHTLYQSEFKRTISPMETITISTKLMELDWYGLSQIVLLGHTPRLKELKLGGGFNNSVDDKAIQHLAPMIVGHLQKVDLGLTDIGADGCRALAEAAKECGPNVKLQDLKLACADDKALKHLAPLIVGHLQKVDLQLSDIGADGCRALAEAAKDYGPDVKLQDLNLVGAKSIDDKALTHLAPLIVGHLQKVHLGGTSIGADGCRALAEAAKKFGSNARLQELDLRDAESIDDKALMHLAPLIVGHLYKVNLASTAVGAEGCKTLAGVTKLFWPNVKLRYLNLTSAQSVDNIALKHLAPLIVGSLHKVDLTSIPVGAEGCHALAEAAEDGGPNVRLRELELHCAKSIDDIALLKHLAPLIVGHLQKVDLHSTKADSQGCQLLVDAAAANLPKTSPLTMLSICITDESACRILCQLFEHSPLLEIYVDCDEFENLGQKQQLQILDGEVVVGDGTTRLPEELLYLSKL